MIAELKNQQFDLIVVGGGITGAGIALDAVTRGMSVALVEKSDFASGTSSKSTKLIHGGLRYLKQFDFWLVKEVGTERAVLHELAPHLVVPEKMLLPIIKEGTYGSWLTSIGLKIYDVLASVEGDDKRRMLSKEEALEKEPLLPDTILEGAGYYAEYRTDDARLTLEVLKTAFAHGAMTLNYCEVKEFLSENQAVSGVRVHDHYSDENFEIKGKYVVNATGPWVDELRSRLEDVSQQNKRLQPTKGVHLVVPFEKFPLRQSVYFDVPDGRMIFGIPRGRITYVGTTDTKYYDDLDLVQTQTVDALYLINAVNQMFPDIHLELDDIESTWAGLRPLIFEDGKSASELSRKDEIFESQSGLISIAGGKLTGYRKMSERIVDLVAKRMENRYDLKFKEVMTHVVPLTKRSFPNYKAVDTYIEEKYEVLKEFNFSKKAIKSLVHRYGRQLDSIIASFLDKKESDPDLRMVLAELDFCLTHEMCLTSLDFLERRTGRLLFEVPSTLPLVDKLVKVMAGELRWSNQRKKEEKEKVQQAFLKNKKMDLLG